MDLGQIFGVAFLAFVIWMVWSSMRGSARDSEARQQAKIDEMRRKFRAIPGHEEMNEETWESHYYQILSATQIGQNVIATLSPEELRARQSELELRQQGLMEAYKDKYGVDFEK